jgi:hypothetical protein
MIVFDNENYKIELNDACLPKIRFDYKNHKTGEILIKEFNEESFIKKIFSKQILDNFNIKDLFI